MIIVTEKSELLRNCDQVITLEEGKVSQVESLLKQSELKEEEAKVQKNLENQIEIESSSPNAPPEEEDASGSVAFYLKYMFYHRLNLVLIPMSLALFVASEALISLIFFIYAKFDAVKAG